MSVNRKGFSELGEWYKGNLHCHSTNSDGALSPEAVAELYKNNGYQFLAISDHDFYSDYREEFDTEDFVILPAMEASAVLYVEEGKTDRYAVHHVHGILGTKQMQEACGGNLYKHKEYCPPKTYYGTWNGAEAAQELSDELKAHGCITTYNHPIWSRVKEEDFIHIKGITALEIYNYGTVNESGTGYDTVHWDVMLRNGNRVHAFASDDNHNDGIVEDSFGGYIMVKAEELNHESIVQAIIDGNYYSSCGPEIYDWGIRDGVAYVECSEVKQINFIAGNLINAGTTLFKKDRTMTKGEFTLKGNENYIRVECIDKYGKIAWSNPIYLGE